MRAALAGLLAVLGSGAVSAQGSSGGDPAAGEAHFAERCVECHFVESQAGELLVGTKPRAGPNLFGVAGRQPAGLPRFFFSPLMRSYGQTGVVWDEANFVGYVQDPTGFLQAATGETGRSRMPPGLVADEQEAHDLWAYLATFSPEAGSDTEAGAAVPEGEPASE